MISINGQTVESGEATDIALVMGANVISIDVTAQDGVTKNTYRLNVTRVSAAWQSVAGNNITSNSPVGKLLVAGNAVYIVHDCRLEAYSGSTFVTSAKYSSPDPTDFAVSAWNGYPCVAFRGMDGKASVMYYDGNKWVAVGATGFSDGSATDFALCADGGALYVAYSDGAAGGKTTVMKYDGNIWAAAGNTAFTAGAASGLSLALWQGEPCLACSDAAEGGKGELWKLDAGVWNLVGGPFSPDTAQKVSLAIDGDTPYVAYLDGSCSGKATVMRYGGSSWEVVGAPGVSARSCSSLALAIEDGAPYLAYTSSTIVVLRYDGQDWANESSPVDYGAYADCVDFKQSGGILYCLNYRFLYSSMDSLVSKLQPADDPTLREIDYYDTIHQYFSYGKRQLVASGTTDYSVEVPGYVSSIGITPYASDRSATMLIDGVKMGNNTKTLSLEFGPNITTITAKSADGSVTMTYTFTVTRLRDDNLRGIGLSAGALSPGFYPTTTEYTATVDSSVKQLTVTPQAFDGNVSIKINGSDIEPGQSRPVSLATGLNDIKLDVSSSDRSLSQTYTIHVQREAWSWQNEGGVFSTGVFGKAFPAVVGGVPYLIVPDSGKIKVERCIGTAWETVSECPLTFTYIDNFAQDGSDFYLQLGEELVKFNGNDWDIVCYLPVSFTDVEGLVVNEGIPYLSYYDGSPNRRLHVSKFVQNEWIPLGGSAPVDDNGFFGSDLEVDAGNVYIAYKDSSYNRHIVVKEFDGAGWVTIGGEGCSPCLADTFSLKIDHGTPYLAHEYYQDYPTAGVLKYDGTGWTALDDDYFVYSSGAPILLAVEDGTPYVSFLDNQSSRAIFKLVNGSWQELGKAGLSSGSGIINMFMLHGSPCLFVKGTGYYLQKFQTSDSADLLRVGVASPEGVPAYSDAVIAPDGSQSLSIEVPCYLSSVTLDPVPADMYSTVEINGKAVWYGTKDAVALGAGDNVFTVKVTSCDGSASKEYTLTINRKPDASLKSLAADAGGLNPIFNPGKYTYAMTVAGTVGSIRLTAMQSDPSATVKINGVEAAGPVDLPINAGDNTFRVSVTSADGMYTLDYKLVVTRTPFIWQDAGSGLPKSYNLSLDSIGGTPYIAFINASGYLQVMKNNGTAWQPVGNIGARKADCAGIATDKSSGAVYVSYYEIGDKTNLLEYTEAGWADIALPAGVGADELFAGNGALYTAYSSGNHASVAKYDGNQWTILGDSGLSSISSLVVLDGVPYVSGSRTDSLVRRYSGSSWEDAGDTSILGGADLIALDEDGGAVYAAITGGQRSFNDIALMKLTGSGWEQVGGLLHVADNYLSMLQLTVDSGIPRVASFTVYNNVITISEYQNGQWQNLAVYKDAPLVQNANFCTIHGVPWYAYEDANNAANISRMQSIGDASLAGIALSDGTVLCALDDPGCKTFTATTNKSSLTISPFASDKHAAIKVNGATVSSGSATSPADLALGQNTFTIDVTSLDGASHASYTLTVVRKSTDSKLKDLRADGSTVQDFNPDHLEYDLGKALCAAVSLNLSAASNDSNASVEGAGTYALKLGLNSFTISVTAEDGVTVSDYVIKVYRQSDDSRLSSVTIGGTVLQPGPGVYALDLSVPAGTSSLALSAVAADAHAKVTCPASVAPAPGQNVAKVTVLSEDGTSLSTYSLNIYREQKTDDVTLQKQGEGEVSGSGSYQVGDQVDVTASPAAGYHFLNWVVVSGNAALADSGSASTSFVMPDGTVILKAIFEKIHCSVSLKASQGGTVQGSGGYFWGDLATLTATPKAGYRFSGWMLGSETVSNNYRYQFTVTKDVTLQAVFSLIGKPASLSSASAGYDSVTLKWAAVDGATGYEIYRAASASGTYKKLTATTKLTFTNTGLITGSTYYYQVRAYCTAGTVITYGPLSAVSSAAPKPAEPALTVLPASYKSISVKWNAVPGATRYELFRATSPSGTFKLLYSTTALSYTNTGLITGNTYYYRVRAYRVVGSARVYGNYSRVKYARTTLLAPTRVKATRATQTSIKVSWAAVAGATKYEVWRSTASDGAYSLVTTTASLSITNAGLRTGTVYFYKVRAYRLVGTTRVYSPFSVIVSAKP